jgi:type IV secretory pathway VirJ component
MKGFLISIMLFFISPDLTCAMAQDTLRYGIFGKIMVYKPAATPDALVLFISGDGGWESGVIDMAAQLVAKGAMVAGIDIRHYMSNLKKLHSKCYYPASDFESLSLFLQKKFRFSNYFKPILVGYSSGATLGYGILAQSPANTFKGLISLGFCPDLETDKPLCTGNGLKMHLLKEGKSWYLDPCYNLTSPFIVLLGIDDKVCPFKATESFLKNMQNSELIALPKVGHGFAVMKNWLPQLLLAYGKVQKAASYPEVVSAKNLQSKLQQVEKLESNLPLTTLLPAMKIDSMPLLIFLSGDGGWTSFDQGISEKLADKGIPVIGLDCQKYFWQARTPSETAIEIAKVIRHYMNVWGKKSFVLCGYSFGADIIPYLLTGLPADLDHQLSGAVMMSPDPAGDFEIHVADMLSLGSSKDTYDVLAELKKSARKRVVCIFGDEEGDSYKLFREVGASLKLLPGTHHYDNNYNAISHEIMASFY